MAAAPVRAAVPTMPTPCRHPGCQCDREWIAAQHYESDQPSGRALVIPTHAQQCSRVAQRHSLALGDRRPGLDATALRLEVGKRFCGLLALDDEGRAGLPLIGHDRGCRVRSAPLGHDAIDRGDPPVEVGQFGGGHLDARVKVCGLHGPGSGGHGSVADVRSRQLRKGAGGIDYRQPGDQ
jgi:hypothetical protein